MSTEQLIRAAGELSLSELEQFVSKVIILQAQRRAPSLPSAEAALLQKINQSIPAELRQRYDKLVARRQAERLTPQQHQELLRLTSEVEALESRRLEALAELARLRQTTLSELMKALGLTTPMISLLSSA